jgi:hypothetical protein
VWWNWLEKFLTGTKRNRLTFLLTNNYTSNMGADLYIESITEPAKAKHEPRFNAAVTKRDSLDERIKYLRPVLVAQVTMATAIPSARKTVKRYEAEIAKLTRQREAAQKEVSEAYDAMYPSAGYFRDSYNGTSVLWRLELSWWKDIPASKPTAAQLRSFLAKLKARKLKPVTAKELRENNCTVDTKENSVKVWQKYFRNKKRRLVRFLERAVKAREAGSEVYFSV